MLFNKALDNNFTINVHHHSFHSIACYYVRKSKYTIFMVIKFLFNSICKWNNSVVMQMFNLKRYEWYTISTNISRSNIYRSIYNNSFCWNYATMLGFISKCMIELSYLNIQLWFTFDFLCELKCFILLSLITTRRINCT